MERKGKVIGTFAGKPVTLQTKSEETAIVFNGRRISEIQFTGKTEALKLN
ncbi:MAG TPA: hypothetical protein VGR81_13690 [Candidatus Acidoferrales bacterium]|nr:hypothetical protein [Candidatus Acidoferrales bacterium]